NTLARTVGTNRPGFHRCCALVIPIEFLQSPEPTIPLVLHQSLQQSQRRRLSLAATVFDGAAKWRDVVKSRGLRQEPSNLHVRIRAPLLATEDLHDQPIAEDGRRITLFRTGDSCRQRLGAA